MALRQRWLDRNEGPLPAVDSVDQADFNDWYTVVFRLGSSIVWSPTKPSWRKRGSKTWIGEALRLQCSLLACRCRCHRRFEAVKTGLFTSGISANYPSLSGKTSSPRGGLNAPRPVLQPETAASVRNFQPDLFCVFGGMRRSIRDGRRSIPVRLPRRGDCICRCFDRLPGSAVASGSSSSSRQSTAGLPCPEPGSGVGREGPECRDHAGPGHCAGK